MKVLQISAFNGWGCTGRIVHGIHNSLVENGDQSIVAWGRTNTVIDNSKTIKIGNKFDQVIHGLYTRITDKCGFGSKIITKKFLKQIDEYKPDLIHLHIMHGYYINIELLFNYIKNNNIPVIWTFHDCWAFTGHCPYFDLVGCEKWKSGCYDCKQKYHHPSSWVFDKSKWNWNKKKELLLSIDNLTIVTPSKWMANLVKQSFLKDKNIEVINNGIDVNVFKPTYSDFKRRYNLEDKKIILGVSSTWVKSKGINDFIKLSKIISNDYVIVLVGVTKEQKSEASDNIIYIERTDNVIELAEIYTASSIFVNPTYEDNYPTTNLEAMACGTPVITYNTGGSVESVQDSRYGSIIEKGCIENLYTEIMLQCEDLPTKKCLYRCSDKNSYFKYIKLYSKILGE